MLRSWRQKSGQEYGRFELNFKVQGWRWEGACILRTTAPKAILEARTLVFLHLRFHAGGLARPLAT